MSDEVLPTLFERRGHRWTATEYARGPWDARHCHGGPVSALLARACETVADHGQESEDGGGPATEWQIARLTVELTHPVPVGVPLDLVAAVERPGRKVSLVGAALSADGTDVARVRALRIRRRDFALPEHPLAPEEMSVDPSEARHERLSWATDEATVAFHSHGAEHRIAAGSWNDPGPVEVWIRLRTCVVAGETPSGVQRAAAAADFGNGVSSAIDHERFLYINPDLTMHLARPPEGEWIGMASHSLYGTPTASTGSGFAESALHDERGRVGRSVQSLFVDPR